MIPGLKAGPGFHAASGVEWTKVAQSTFSVANGSGNQTETLPGTPLEDDIVVVAIASDGVTNQEEGGGGIEVAYTLVYDPAGSNPGCQVAYKRMPATPDTSVDIFRHTTKYACGIIQIWRGAHTTTAIDAAATSDTGASGYPDAPSYTTITAGALRIIVGFMDDDDDASNATTPAGYTDFLASDTGQASTTAGSTVMIASKEAPSAGADNPAAFTGTDSDEWKACHFALRPA